MDSSIPPIDTVVDSNITPKLLPIIVMGPPDVGGRVAPSTIGAKK